MKELEQSQQALKNGNDELLKDREKLTTQNTELAEKIEALTAEKRELNNKITGLATDKENLTKDKENLTKDKAELQKRVKELEQSQQALKNGNDELLKDREKLTTQNTELAEKIEVLTTEKTELNNKITGLSTEKDKLTRERDKLTTEKEKLNTDLSTAKTQAEQTSQKLNELERRHAPYKKLERLYEVFLEVKGCLNFGFVEKTHSAMDLIASVLSDSKYYLESLYNKASQELSDKRSDKGEKLAELFDLLFEYIKDNKFERLKEPSAYDHSCKKLYPEQNTSQKMRRVVLRGYTYDKKIACYTIVDMGS